MYRNSHDYIDTGVGHSAMNHRVNGWIMRVTGTTGYYFDNGGVAASLWNANAWRNRGALLGRMGRATESEEALARSRELEPPVEEDDEATQGGV